MKLYLLALIISHAICITFSTRYELEFLSTEIYTPCKGNSNNSTSMRSVFDMSTLKVEQTEDGSIKIKGYAIIQRSFAAPTPLSIEVYKKIRGTWQPTVFTQKRPDLCTATFNRAETWYYYFKSIPKEQRTCPFRKGQRLDLNINEPTYIDLPNRNFEGEYKARMEIGYPNGDFYMCDYIFSTVHKV